MNVAPDVVLVAAAPRVPVFEPGDLEYLSEDWAFSHRCRAANVLLYCWAMPRLVHWGLHGFTLEDVMQKQSER